MTTADHIFALIHAYGLWVFVPLAVIEGPIVTVIAGYFSRIGLLDPVAVLVAAVAADLGGDAIYYALGRWGKDRISPRWRHRLRLDDARLDWLRDQFVQRGGRILVTGKLTHSAGMFVLLAAGLARMPFGAFLGWNLLATLPKSGGFFALGYVMGQAYTSIDHYLARGAAILLGLMLTGAAAFWYWRRRNTP